MARAAGWNDPTGASLPWPGLTGYTLYQLGFILGLSRTSPFSSSLLIAMVPLFTVLILAIMGEPTPLQGWVGLGVALVGVALFLLDKRGASAGTLLGDLLSIGAAVAFASLRHHHAAAGPQVPGGDRTPPGVSWRDRALAPRLAAGCAEAGLADSFSFAAWLSIVYLAIFPVYIAYILWNYAIARRGVAKASSFGLLVPIVAGLLSAIFFGEPFGPLKLLGAGLVLAGLVIVRTRVWRRPAAKGATV